MGVYDGAGYVFGTTDNILIREDAAGTGPGFRYRGPFATYYWDVGTTAFFYSVCVDVDGQPAKYTMYKRKIINCVDEVYQGVTNKRIYLDAAVPFPNGNYSTAHHLFLYDTEIFGGGIRVKSINTTDNGVFYKTSYEYVTQESGLSMSSGVVTSLPWLYGTRNYLSQYVSPDPVSESVAEFYNYSRVFLDHPESYNRPAPCVIYSRVIVKNVNEGEQSQNGQTVYEFFTPKDKPYEVALGSQQFTANDISGIYCKPKSIAYYEQVSGSTYRKVREDRTNYAYSSELTNYGPALYKGTRKDDAERSLGKVQERYISSVEGGAITSMTRNFENVFETGGISKTYSYANATTTTVLNTVISESKNIVWDALSGQVLGIATKDSKGDVQAKKNTPAYWKYDQAGEMEEKNMLTQNFQEAVYGPVGLSFDNVSTYTFPNADILSSALTTWSSQWAHDGVTSDGVWRVNDTYLYDRKFTYTEFPSASLRSMDEGYIQPTTACPWQKTTNVTKYNRYSNAIEDRSMDGIYSSSIYGYKDALPIAIVTGAKKDEAGYMSVEDGWAANGCLVDGTQFHSGIFSAKSQSNSGPYKKFYCIDGIDKNKTYIAEAWVYGSGGTAKIKIDICNSANTVLATQENNLNLSDDQWKHINVKVIPQDMVNLPSDGYLKVSCGIPSNTGYVDDVRFYPLDASMSTYTYDPLTWKVTSITDKNNITTYYEYDEAGRLKLVRDQDKNIVKRNTYHYTRQQ